MKLLLVHRVGWNGVCEDFNKPMNGASLKRVKKDIKAFMFYESCVKIDALSLNNLKVMDSRSKNCCEAVCGGTNHCQGIFLLDSVTPLICALPCPETFVSLSLLTTLCLYLGYSYDGVNFKMHCFEMYLIDC